MPRPKSKVWKFWNKNPNGSVSCKYCAKTFKYPNVNKMSGHLNKCVKCPREVRKCINSFGGNDYTEEFSQNSQPCQQDSRSSASSLSTNLSATPSLSATLKTTRAGTPMFKSFLDSMSTEENVSAQFNRPTVICLYYFGPRNMSSSENCFDHISTKVTYQNVGYIVLVFLFNFLFSEYFKPATCKSNIR